MTLLDIHIQFSISILSLGRLMYLMDSSYVVILHPSLEDLICQWTPSTLPSNFILNQVGSLHLLPQPQAQSSLTQTRRITSQMMSSFQSCVLQSLLHIVKRWLFWKHKLDNSLIFTLHNPPEFPKKLKIKSDTGYLHILISYHYPLRSFCSNFLSPSSILNLLFFSESYFSPGRIARFHHITKVLSNHPIWNSAPSHSIPLSWVIFPNRTTMAECYTVYLFLC